MMENVPYYKTKKYNYYSHEPTVDDDECDEDNESCPTAFDLLLLRKNAIGEREAIASYLHAATKSSGSLAELFIDTAHDEIIHFRKLMILLAKYDPPQRQAFEDVGINLPNELRKTPSPNYCFQDKIDNINLLTKAIVGELEALNLYQESYEKAQYDDVKTLFCNNANDEKIHLAEFWKALMVITKENNTMP